MATCESLEVRTAFTGYSETVCVCCVHREVCQHKQTYLEFLRACEKMRSDYPYDVSFVKRNKPECNFYKKKSDVVFRQTSVKAVDCRTD